MISDITTLSLVQEVFVKLLEQALKKMETSSVNQLEPTLMVKLQQYRMVLWKSTERHM
ncbi:hypothetical protein EVA_16892 [gut metagenome]|uniref:Uncharacterized protein n=1 Tax=gut metagenome TaxID=749906 RepID=J9FKQ0_9ZZZZ